MKTLVRPATAVFTGDYYYFGNPLDSVRYGDLPLHNSQGFDLSSIWIMTMTWISFQSTTTTPFNTLKTLGTATEFNYIPTSFNRSTTLTIYDTGGD